MCSTRVSSILGISLVHCSVQLLLDSLLRDNELFHCCIFLDFLNPWIPNHRTTEYIHILSSEGFMGKGSGLQISPLLKNDTLSSEWLVSASIAIILIPSQSYAYQSPHLLF